MENSRGQLFIEDRRSGVGERVSSRLQDVRDKPVGVRAGVALPRVCGKSAGHR